MERNGMMEVEKRQSCYWWFDDQKNSAGRSQWLKSTLSELDERTKSMLKIIEEDADSFSQRAEMYYEKRPQLVTLVEDFYRIHRSLAIQFDNLKHDPATRLTSPLIRSFSISTDDSSKSHDVYDYEGLIEKSYSDSEESIDSEVDDPMPDLLNHDLMSEIDRLKEEAMIQKTKLLEKEREMEELKQKLDELQEEKDESIVENETLKKMMEEKDEEKREVIRQLSLAIEMLKGENLYLKKSFVNEKATKKWNPFEFQAFKGFKKMFKPSVVPL